MRRRTNLSAHSGRKWQDLVRNNLKSYSKVIYPKYSKHRPYDCDCSKMLNNDVKSWFKSWVITVLPQPTNHCVLKKHSVA